MFDLLFCDFYFVLVRFREREICKQSAKDFIIFCGLSEN